MTPFGSPSARIVAEAHATAEVRDTLGRRLAVRRLNALDKLRLFKAAGPALSHNAPWLGTAVLAASVSAIDDVPVPFPASEAQVEALVARLDEAGLQSVASWLRGGVTAPVTDREHALGN